MTNTSPTQSTILIAAQSLFWKYGIKKTTVEEIAQEAGISKMTFYRYFKNKEEVAKTVLSTFMEKGFKEYKALLNSKNTFLEKVTKMIEMEKRFLNEFSEEFLKDIYTNQNVKLKELFDSYQQKTEECTLEFYKNAQKEGWIREDFKVDFIIYQMNSLNEKVNDPELLQYFSSTKEAVIALLNHFFYGIISNDKR